MSELKLSLSADDTRTLIIRAGFMLRNLRNSLRELGYDQILSEVAGGIPDARARLGYVVTMTENAASEVLGCVELTQPAQTTLQDTAESLLARWNSTAITPENEGAARALAEETRTWLGTVPQLTGFTRQQLQAVMMAQGFQDLTGQIIQRMTKMLNELEVHLVQVLRDNVPAQPVAKVASPPAAAQPSESPSASQDDVDDLLASLGL
ncbi:protein phosphatase CheZ [Pantoea sp. BS_4]|uniref:protein phosphatase CheZ n=1 Tax=Pantoea TaxID=53335 RepID=UPI000543EC1B|nr:protein phosphatase CheZ [Pantoea stewartii]KHE02222.1 methionyl-tRNA synthetase [Pantoea stewartii]KHN61794.1 methionyl-tRNA synthetase [Pantoea stewartii]